MLRTGQLSSSRFDGKDLSFRREPYYRGSWHLPRPDLHRLADASLSLGFALVHHLLSSSGARAVWAHWGHFRASFFAPGGAG